MIVSICIYNLCNKIFIIFYLDFELFSIFFNDFLNDMKKII